MTDTKLIESTLRFMKDNEVGLRRLGLEVRIAKSTLDDYLHERGHLGKDQKRRLQRTVDALSGDIASRAARMILALRRESWELAEISLIARSVGEGARGLMVGLPDNCGRARTP